MRIKRTAGAVIAGVGLAASLMPGTAYADHGQTAKRSGWECTDIIWQNDGDKGGRSGKAIWRYDRSTTNYVEFDFYSLGERMVLNNKSGKSAEAYVKRSSDDTYLGRLDIGPINGGVKKRLHIAEGTRVYLVLYMPAVGRCTTTKVIT